MRMDIALPLMRTLSKLLCTALLLAFSCRPASAQSSAGGAQAQLHVQVIVAPVIIPPDRHRDRDRGRGRDRDGAAVAYNLSPSTEALSITQDVRIMPVEIEGQGARAEEVRCTTIVAK